MDEHDQYESLDLDDSLEDERDLDQIMEDRRAAEVELDTRDAQFTRRKLPELLHDHGKKKKLPESRIFNIFPSISACSLTHQLVNTLLRAPILFSCALFVFSLTRY